MARPVHPGKILLEDYLRPRGLSQYRLAKEAQVPLRRINEIVLGRRGVSADTAVRLARYFGTAPEFWLNLQGRYEMGVAAKGAATGGAARPPAPRAAKRAFDVIVVTAANEAQAAGYRAQLAWRQAHGFFPEGTEVLVVPDPGGRRVGSLGATLNVFRALAKTRPDPFTDRRVLICHSGGDSRRTPAYAAMGKAFTPLPCRTEDGRPLALFDLIVRNAGAVPERAGGQVLILAGDVLLTFDTKDIDFSRPGLTGVAWFAEMARGSRHGVYVVDEEVKAGYTACRRVANFLQKPSAAEATEAGAVDEHGRVAVDTGILSLDPTLCKTMLAFAKREARWLKTAPSLDLYEQFAFALLGRGEPRLAACFEGTPFHVNVLPFCDFFHIGSSRELLAGITEASRTATAHAFTRGVLAAGTAPEGLWPFNAVIEASVKGGRAGLVEGCWLKAPVTLGERCILTGVPAACTAPIELPQEAGLVCVPIGRADWTAIAYRLSDDFKRDGKWEAKLWKVGRLDDVVAHAQEVLAGRVKEAPSLHALGELIPQVNHGRMLAARNEVFREVNRVRVAEAVSQSYQAPTEPRAAAILKDQVVWATSPVRIDLAGGWSDTPPICLEQGGTVVNAAVTLNGQYPVQAMAKLTDEPRIRVSSIDLGDSRVFATSEEILDHSDPRDWCAIPKAALVLAGIAPSRKGASLRSWLERLGGGLDLTIFSALPKGSGMGTSSILGATVLACLDRVLGIAFDAERIIRLTSILEQRMCTGGGWQDQIGGLLPGVKIIETQPGFDQTPTCRPLPFAYAEEKDLAARCLLYFTGQKRMARNILNNVVDRYVSRAGDVLDIVDGLKAGAQRMADALEARDLDGFAAGVREYWSLKKRIDPGSTNPEIEALLARVEKETVAVLLPGAGGGGFVFMVAKSAPAARRLRADLEANPPNAAARFFDFTVDPVGLKVTVL
ncbi:MAG: HigA family addiction module antitoxin [Kiritimatiellia bacterium]